MEDNEHPPAPAMEASAPEVVERPLWQLSRDEQRVLIITFVGGLASIVAGASVIGGAIALVRWQRGQHLPHPLGFLIGATAVSICLAVYDVYNRHRAARLPVRFKPPSYLYMWLVFWPPVFVFLLVWIGLAAGIH
jgi:hypothetical protein